MDSLLKENGNGAVPAEVMRKVDELQTFIAEPIDDKTIFPQRVAAIKVSFLFNIIQLMLY